MATSARRQKQLLQVGRNLTDEQAHEGVVDAQGLHQSALEWRAASTVLKAVVVEEPGFQRLPLRVGVDQRVAG